MKFDKEQGDGCLEDVFTLKEVIHAVERELLRSTMDNGTAICEDASIEDADFAVRDYYMTCRTAYYLCNHAQTLIAKLMAETEKGR